MSGRCCFLSVFLTSGTLRQPIRKMILRSRDRVPLQRTVNVPCCWTHSFCAGCSLGHIPRQAPTPVSHRGVCFERSPLPAAVRFLTVKVDGLEKLWYNTAVFRVSNAGEDHRAPDLPGRVRTALALPYRRHVRQHYFSRRQNRGGMTMSCSDQNGPRLTDMTPHAG